MGCAPTGRLAAHVDAHDVPIFFIGRLAQPGIGVADPSAKNETVPLPSFGVMVAVNVTGVPCATLDAVAVTVVDVSASLTMASVDGANALEPMPLAVVPAGSATRTGVPLAVTVPLPSWPRLFAPHAYTSPVVLSATPFEYSDTT